jgi:Carbohydrate-selective porin, OprB family
MARRRIGLVLDVETYSVVRVLVGFAYFIPPQRHGHLLGPEGGIQITRLAIELTYRYVLRKSGLFIQPDFQYVIRPGGTIRLNNGVLFGAQFGIF